MRNVNIILQEPTPIQPITPLALYENVVIISNTQTYQKGKVRKKNNVRALNAYDFTTNMFPYLSLDSSNNNKILDSFEFIGAVQYSSNGNITPFTPQALTSSNEPTNVKICTASYTNGSYYFSQLNVGDYFVISDIIPSNLTDLLSGFQIVCFGLNDWFEPIELRFKYYFTDGTDTGDNYAKITIINTPANKDSYLDMDVLPVKIFCGKDMITPITYDAIINAFNNTMIDFGGGTDIISFINNNFINAPNIIQFFGTNLSTYGLSFINKVHILDVYDPNNHYDFIIEERLKLYGDRITNGQGIDHRVLKMGALTFNGFGLDETITIELLFGLEALMYGSIFFSHDDSDSI